MSPNWLSHITVLPQSFFLSFADNVPRCFPWPLGRNPLSRFSSANSEGLQLCSRSKWAGRKARVEGWVDWGFWRWLKLSHWRNWERERSKETKVVSTKSPLLDLAFSIPIIVYTDSAAIWPYGQGFWFSQMYAYRQCVTWQVSRFMKWVWSFSNSQWERGWGKRIPLKFSKHQPRNSLGTPRCPTNNTCQTWGCFVDATATSVSSTSFSHSLPEKLYLSVTFFYLHLSHGSRGKWKYHQLFPAQICHQSTEPFEQLLLSSSRRENKCFSQKIFNRIGWVTRLRGEMKDRNLKNSALNRKKSQSL